MGPALALGGNELQPAALDALLGRQVERRPAAFHHSIDVVMLDLGPKKSLGEIKEKPEIGLNDSPAWSV